VPLPPIDGPCELSVSGDFPPLRSTCSAGSREFTDVASKAAAPAQVKQVHWLIGIAADKTLPLRSIVLVADVFVERFEGLGRPPDWTAEFGVRRQVSTRLVFDAAVGRHYSGTEPSTFLTFGTSFSQPFLVPHPR
jgi:hypothetical protein